MVVVCASVLLGTLYPLIVEAFSNNKISVGEPYYNSIVVPIMMPAILIMGIGPILSLNKENISTTIKKLIPGFFLTTITTIIFFLIYRSYSILGIVGITLSSWLISNNMSILIKKFLKVPMPNYSKSMIIAHIGVGLLIFGITGSSVWQKEKITRVNVNGTTIFNEYNTYLTKYKDKSSTNTLIFIKYYLPGIFLLMFEYNGCLGS